MPTPVRTLTLRRPRSLKAALAMLADDPTLTPIAGCTDVLVGLHFGTLDKRRFIDLWPLDDLRGIRLVQDKPKGLSPHARTGGDKPSGLSIRIGALATFTDIIKSALVQRRVPMLVAAAREVGGAQIQNRGTLGGNIANASPAGDTLPVLSAANARIVLRSASGERVVPFNDFYTGYRTSVRQPSELIAAIEIPPIDGRQWWRKVGTRRAQAISKVMMAGVRGPEVRVAIGSVAPTVLHASAAAAVLSRGGSIADAQAALRSEIAPIDDIRSTGDYRRQVAENLLAVFWKETR
ncbi:MAG: FAD binding domain-containing protein [Acidobacteriota bacterium]|nr:FAD binding domain-containing protein [Acidobacteriota bacterium]